MPLLTKLRIAAFVFTQDLFGPFSMWTNVDYQESSARVNHSTKLKKWGIVFYRSEKVFELDADGQSLRLTGFEYFWPLGQVAVSFAPLSGRVDESAMRANYQMPLAGAVCDCRTYLNQPQGFIEIQNPWLKGRFTLTGSSVEQMALRLT